jgi:hypothetical protein
MRNQYIAANPRINETMIVLLKYANISRPIKKIRKEEMPKLLILFLVFVFVYSNFHDNIKSENIAKHITALYRIGLTHGSRDDFAGYNDSVSYVANTLSQYTNYYKAPIIQKFIYQGNYF